MSRARPASTIVLMRPSKEILFLRRSRKASFFPDAWVFPGGRVDDADSQAARSGDDEHLRVSLDTAVLREFREERQLSSCTASDFAVAACRETFEEAGVWLGSGRPQNDLRQRLNDRAATLCDAPELTVDLERMELWSWWITPEQEPKRYDTRFFISFLTDQEADLAVQDDIETVDLCWLSPRDAVQKHEDGAFFLAPPTYITLRELMVYPTIEALRSEARKRLVMPIMPIHKKRSVQEGLAQSKPLGVEIVLPGHSDHPDGTPELEGTKIVLGDKRWSWDS